MTQPPTQLSVANRWWVDRAPPVQSVPFLGRSDNPYWAGIQEIPPSFQVLPPPSSLTFSLTYVVLILDGNPEHVA